MHAFLSQDWIWSVGCNPLSITSQGWHVSKFHSDTIARSYILTALDESILMVNSAIHRLVTERTCILFLNINNFGHPGKKVRHLCIWMSMISATLHFMLPSISLIARFPEIWFMQLPFSWQVHLVLELLGYLSSWENTVSDRLLCLSSGLFFWCLFEVDDLQ